MDSRTDTLTSVGAIIIAAAIGFAIAFWVWPWLGPQILQPCPQWTGLGVGLYTAYRTLVGVGLLMRAQRLDAMERKLKKHEAAHQVWRELIMGKR